MPSRDGEQLVGRWRLVSYVARADDGSRAFPLGRNAQGSLLYTSGGWMAAQVGAADRERFTTEDFVGASDAERAIAFSSYLAYCGPYQVAGDVVTHHVVMSSIPNWVGTEQVRSFELVGDELLLRTPPIEVGGRMLINEFRWRREEA
jgi:Lipocalin-like domain